MTTNSYWPRQQVYLYATLALFPDRLSGRPLNQHELSSYIPFYFEPEEQVETLRALKDKNLLKYTETKLSSGEREYVISDIDNGKFESYLIEYLERFKNDELIPESSLRPDDFLVIEAKLNEYLQRSTREQPTVNPMNIWQNWTSFEERRYPFLEILLCKDLIDHEIKILDISMNGTQGSDEVTQVTLSKTEKFSQKLSGSEFIPHKAKVVLENVDAKNRALIIKANGKDYIVKESLRTDLGPHSLMQYLITNPGKNVSLDYARKRIDGCEMSTDLSEVIRQCNFSKELKEIFFDRCGIKDVQLKKDPYITEAQLNTLLN